MKGEVQFSLGFMKSSPAFPFGSPSSFGAPGAGGSLGFADPETKIGYAYVPNRKSVCLHGDPRDIAIRDALYSALPVATHLEIESRKPHSVVNLAKRNTTIRV
jgi:CubicO group peptidase (beta-lactamase class C family)